MADKTKTHQVTVDLDETTWNTLHRVASDMDRFPRMQAARVLRHWAEKVAHVTSADPSSAVDVDLDTLP